MVCGCQKRNKGSDQNGVANGWFVRGWWILSTTVTHACPHYRGERFYKNGHTVRGGATGQPALWCRLTRENPSLACVARCAARSAFLPSTCSTTRQTKKKSAIGKRLTKRVREVTRKCYRWRDSNPHSDFSKTDFKSVASAISPHRLYTLSH